MADYTPHSTGLLHNHAVLICTKNRIEALRRCLSAVFASNAIPQLIRIVDATPNPVPLSVMLPMEHPITVEHYQAREASLPAQRNQALKDLPDHVTHIHFLDDDFYPEANYFKEIDQFSQQNTDWVMCGGLITNNQQSAESLGLLHELLMIDSTTPGHFLPSGATSEPQSRDDLASRSPFKVDWVSGCAMCMHRNVITELGCRFDEQLKGYAQDEDLDFCLQVSRHGPVYVVPSARGYHDRLSHQNNAFLPEKRFLSITHRYYVLQKHRPGLISSLCFWWSQCWQFLILVRKSGREELVRATVEAWKRVLGHQSTEELLDFYPESSTH